jgi:phospholipase C
MTAGASDLHVKPRTMMFRIVTAASLLTVALCQIEHFVAVMFENRAMDHVVSCAVVMRTTKKKKKKKKKRINIEKKRKPHNLL